MQHVVKQTVKLLGELYPAAAAKKERKTRWSNHLLRITTRDQHWGETRPGKIEEGPSAGVLT